MTTAGLPERPSFAEVDRFAEPLTGAGEGRVDLWRLDLDQEAGVRSRLERFLTAAEQERAARFRMERHRRRFATCRGMLRHLLGGYLGCRPDEVPIAYGPQGKPAVEPGANPRGLEFNVSHTGSDAILAITWGGPVGVDLERLRGVPEAMSIARRFFSPEEHAWLDGFPAEEISERFLRIWVKKEAFVKGCGGGLSMPTDRFDVSRTNGGTATGRVRGAAVMSDQDWSYSEFSTGPGMLAAIAWSGPEPRFANWDWTAKLLEEDGPVAAHDGRAEGMESR